MSRAARSVRFTLCQRKLSTVVSVIQLLKRHLTALGVNRKRIKLLLRNNKVGFSLCCIDLARQPVSKNSVNWCCTEIAPCNYMYLNIVLDNLVVVPLTSQALRWHNQIVSVTIWITSAAMTCGNCVWYRSVPASSVLNSEVSAKGHWKGSIAQ